MFTTNQLSQAKSPYLLQHANNPVHWQEWQPEVLEHALAIDKPILLSIGYASCHWCHVMEHQCFENEEIAELMNKYFVCIKQDREQRPDIDAIYMDAVQMMGLQGGWPLNVFLMPDLQPFYGGTYFPPKKWISLLEDIGAAFQTHRAELQKSADSFGASLKMSESEKYQWLSEAPEAELELPSLLGRLKSSFDTENGGTKRAPKFPMPSIWQMALTAGWQQNDQALIDHVLLTLNKMAKGGIYDQLNGGWARYSVDAEWFAPHFEKMLYDNAQLLSLYSQASAFAVDKTWISKAVANTITWLEREMKLANGLYASGIDADSEGVEGKFYTFTTPELKETLTETEFQVIEQVYNIQPEGNWEHGLNILAVYLDLPKVASGLDVTVPGAESLLSSSHNKLRALQATRPRPGLDDKALLSWNALLVQGYCAVARSFPDLGALEKAIELLASLNQTFKTQSGEYLRSYWRGDVSIPAQLEDLVTLAIANINLYELTGSEEHLKAANELRETIDQNFLTDEGLYLSSKPDKYHIATKSEIFDNVIPAANSMMYQLHCTLAAHSALPDYTQADLLFAKVKGAFEKDVLHTSNWLNTYLKYRFQPLEFTFAQNISTELKAQIFALPVVVAVYKYAPMPTGRVMVCYNQACLQPVNNLQEVVDQLKSLGLLNAN